MTSVDILIISKIYLWGNGYYYLEKTSVGKDGEIQGSSKN